MPKQPITSARGFRFARTFHLNDRIRAAVLAAVSGEETEREALDRILVTSVESALARLQESGEDIARENLRRVKLAEYAELRERLARVSEELDEVEVKGDYGTEAEA